MSGPWRVFTMCGLQFLSLDRRRLPVAVAAGLSLALLVTLSAQPAYAGPPPGPGGAAAGPGGSVPVGGVPARQETTKGSPVSLSPPSPVVMWPSAGSAVVPTAAVVGATTPATVGERAAIGVSRPGGLPVSVRRPVGDEPRTASEAK